MTLNENQVDELFRFCARKYVHHYDLQVELVDHLAERIEEEMTANEKLTFEEALKKVYGGFGLFGFAHIVQEKERFLRKQHNKTWRQSVKRFFTLPKLIFTVALFAFLYTLSGFVTPEARMWIIFVLWEVGYVYQGICYRRLRKAETKPLMFTQYESLTLGIAPSALIYFLILAPEKIYFPVVFAFVGVAGVIIHAAFTEVAERIHRQARELYPDAFAKA